MDFCLLIRLLLGVELEPGLGEFSRAFAYLDHGLAAFSRRDFRAALRCFRQSRDCFQGFERALIVSSLWIVLATFVLRRAGDVERALKEARSYFAVAAKTERERNVAFGSFTRDYVDFFAAYEGVAKLLLIAHFGEEDEREEAHWASLLAYENCCNLQRKLRAAYQNLNQNENEGLLPIDITREGLETKAQSLETDYFLFASATQKCILIWELLPSTQGVEISARREEIELSELQTLIRRASFFGQGEVLKVLEQAEEKGKHSKSRGVYCRQIVREIQKNEYLRDEIPDNILRSLKGYAERISRRHLLDENYRSNFNLFRDALHELSSHIDGKTPRAMQELSRMIFGKNRERFRNALKRRPCRGRLLRVSVLSILEFKLVFFLFLSF